MPNSAFIVEVPEAEPYVSRLRMRFDPSARLGAPAHVTLLYPFMSPELLNDEVLVPRDGITANCRRVLLIENASGRWRRFRSFELRCQA